MSEKITKVEKEECAKLLNELTSKMMIQPTLVNAGVIKSQHENVNFGENDSGEAIKMDLDVVTEVMENSVEQVKKGDLSSLEEMLICQAYSLQALFMTMVSKASTTTNVEDIELLSKLALKAQNQCRSTIATLSEMKNPKRAMYVKQLNQANQMQVNNDDSEPKNLKKNINPANELLEKTDGERLDTRKTEKTIGDDDAIAAVAEINGA